MEYAQSFNREWVDVTVDTTELTPAAVVGILLARVEAVVESAGKIPGPERTTHPSIDVAVTVITGAGGVGLSTVGFLTFLQGMWGGERVGYVDCHQVGFIGADSRSTDIAPMKARNASAIAAVMARHGVEHVVITADPATSRFLVEIAHPARVFWLDASDPTIESRHQARGVGGGPPLAGDHRFGLDRNAMSASVAAAVVEAHDESIRPQGHVLIGTDHTSAEDVASQITASRRG
ncbi:hypothetical protein [Microterricola gilva]|uniref:hypothetical protein n=1 Tax=Microterricola gilva TaxID=393267 RepID=UPI00102C80CF|nr:hypothetical protein [Microterricola gilva]